MDYQLGPGPLQVDQNTIDEKIKGDIGIVENGDVATHAIPSGYYVIWKGDLYIAKTDISSGTTLSTSNLTAKSKGLGGEVAALNSKIPVFQTHATYTYSSGSVTDWNIAIEQWIDSLGTSNMMQIGTVQISGSGVRMVIVQKFNADYVSAIGFGYWAANVTYYRKVDGVWSFSILAQKSEVDALNGKLSAYNFGSISLADFETKLSAYVATVPVGSALPIVVSISDSSGVFTNTQYMGHLYKITQTRFWAMLYKGAAFDIVAGRYNSGTYEWKKIALQN